MHDGSLAPCVFPGTRANGSFQSREGGGRTKGGSGAYPARPVQKRKAWRGGQDLGWTEISGRHGIQACGEGLTPESSKPGGRVCTEFAACVHSLLSSYFQAAFPDSSELGYVLPPSASKIHSVYVMVALTTFKEIIYASVSSLEVKAPEGRTCLSHHCVPSAPYWLTRP